MTYLNSGRAIVFDLKHATSVRKTSHGKKMATCELRFSSFSIKGLVNEHITMQFVSQLPRGAAKSYRDARRLNIDVKIKKYVC